MKNDAVKIVKKPWGREIWWAQAPKYVGKLLELEKGKRLSKQYHAVKHETLYTLRGSYLMELNGRKKVMHPGSVASIPPGTIHRMEARYGKATILEVSTPELWDVVRLEDDYGRAPTTPRCDTSSPDGSVGRARATFGGGTSSPKGSVGHADGRKSSTRNPT